MAKYGEIKGLSKMLKALQNMGAEGEKRISQTTEANAREIEATAKVYAPKDLGTLSQGIKALEVNKLNWKVATNVNGNAPYTPYQEFGTGGLVEVSDELKDIAIQFKGKGVKQINLKPQPFLYPAFVKGRKQYLEDLKQDLNDLTKKV